MVRVVIFLFLFIVSNFYQSCLAQTESVADGNWNVPEIWSTGVVPDPGTDVIIKHVVTVPAGFNAEAHHLTMDNSEGRNVELKLIGGTARSLRIYGDLFMYAYTPFLCYLQVSYNNNSLIVDGSATLIKNHTGSNSKAPRILVNAGSVTVGGNFDVQIGAGDSGINSVIYMIGDDAHGGFTPTMNIGGQLSLTTSQNSSSAGIDIFDQALLTCGSLSATLNGDEASDRDLKIRLYDQAWFDITGDATVTRSGGNQLYFEIGDSGVAQAQLTISGNLNISSLGGDCVTNDAIKVIIAGLSQFHVGGNMDASSTTCRPFQIIVYDNANVTIDGDLTLTASADNNLYFQFNNSAEFHIGGSVVVNDPLTAGTAIQLNDNSEVVFDNTTTQTVIPAGFTPVNLTVNNPFGILLSSDVTITGIIDLQKGVVDANGNTINMTNTDVNGVVRNDAEATYPSYIYNGKINRNMLAGAGNSYLFPVGDLTTGYSPVTISEPDANSEFTVEYVRGSTTDAGFLANQMEAPLMRVSNLEYWKITKLSGNEVKVTIEWNTNSHDGGGFLDESQLRVGHWNSTSGKWEDYGGTVVDNGDGTGTITSDLVTNFSPITLASLLPESTLPVEWVEFGAKPYEDHVELNWTTASEIENDYFSIEKSIDGQIFTSIGTVKGNGTTSNINHYSFNDDNPSFGITYYRIRQHDYDGNFEYSPAIVVHGQALGQVSIYPNPVVNKINLQFEDTTSDRQVILTDIYGKVLLMKSVKNKSIQFDLAAYTPGNYFVKVISDGSMTIKRILKN